MKNFFAAIMKLTKGRRKVRRWRQGSWFLAAVVSLTLGNLAKAEQVTTTPYDRQMSPVRYVLEEPTANPSDVSMDEVNSYMRNLRAIPYQYTQTWKTPEQVQTDFKADCKSKAIALYSILKKRGVDDLRLVIGMRTKKSSLTHAWLQMTFKGKQYLLDPTFFNAVHSMSTVSGNDYVQFYSYEGDKKFRL